MRVLTGSLMLFLSLGPLGLHAQIPVRKVKPNLPAKVVPMKPQTQPGNQGLFQVALRVDIPGKELHRSSVLVRRDDGRFVLAWEEFNAKMELLGQAQLLDENLLPASGAVATTNPRPEYFGEVHQAVAFANGNLLVAFNETKDARVKLGLFDSRLKALKGLFPLSPSPVSHLVLTRLSGGNTTAAIYFDGQMRMAILNSQGGFELQPTSVIGDVHSESIRGLAATTLPNGLILVAYTPAFLTTALLDSLGNNVRPPKRVATNPQATGLSLLPLEGERVTIGFIDTRDDKMLPTLVFVNPQGDLVGGFNRLWEHGVEWLRPVRLSGGNLFAVLAPSGSPAGMGLGLMLTDASGRVLRGPSFIETNFYFYARSQSLMALSGDRALLFLSGYNDSRTTSAFMILK